MQFFLLLGQSLADTLTSKVAWLTDARHIC